MNHTMDTVINAMKDLADSATCTTLLRAFLQHLSTQKYTSHALTMALFTTQIQTWRRSFVDTKANTGTPSQYMITTDASILLQHKHKHSLNAALGSPQLFWAVSLSDAELEAMISSSVCFGLYHSKSLNSNSTSSGSDGPDTAPPSLSPEDNVELIGLARLVTDKVTFAYLTDVYVLPAFEKRGLGTWLMDCLKEWLGQIPNLRQFTLITGQGRKEEYYAKVLGTNRVENVFGEGGSRFFVKKGPKGV